MPELRHASDLPSVHPPTSRQAARFIVGAIILALAVAFTSGRVTIAAGTPPAAGDIIFNEYASDNDANGNDFFELLVLRDNLDLRGLRVSDNEVDGSGVL